MGLFKRHKGPKKVSSQELGLILGANLMQTEDLHYGLWSDDLELTMANLPVAQQRYSDMVLENIPEGTRSILDVGCGTGHVSELLLARGYEVEGVTPSQFLGDRVRERLGPDYPLHITPFETLETEKRFDLLLFCESFQYMKFYDSLPKALEMLNPGGHVLLSDFFKTGAPGYSPLRGGHKLQEFQEYLKTQPFNICNELDITDQTAPNLDLVDKLLRSYAMPIWETGAFYLQSNYPRSSGLAGKLFRKRLDTLNRKYFSGARNAASFKEHKSYRLMLLQRTDT